MTFYCVNCKHYLFSPGSLFDSLHKCAHPGAADEVTGTPLGCKLVRASLCTSGHPLYEEKPK